MQSGVIKYMIVKVYYHDFNNLFGVINNNDDDLMGYTTMRKRTFGSYFMLVNDNEPDRESQNNCNDVKYTLV